MSTIVVEAEPRDLTGKGPNRRLRAKGLIPAVIYGTKSGSVPVSIDPKEIKSILRSHAGSNTIFELRIKGRESSENVMIKDYQLEPVEHELLHADLIYVAMDHAMSVSVNIELEGIPVGVKNEGGILDFITRSVDINCLPGDIPETIVVDVSKLSLGQHIRAGDLALSEKVKLETATGVVIASVIAPKQVEEEAAAEVEGAVAEEGAEPEVIKKGKTEDEAGSSKE